MDRIKRELKSFRTETKEGFTREEIAQFITKSFPEVDLRTFYAALGTNTVDVIDGKSRIYPWDIELALRACVEQREVKSLEWD